MISVKNIKGLSVNRAGEGKGFRKSPSSHNRWPRGRSLADQSVHCRNTIRRCNRRSNLERNTTEEKIGGRKAHALLGNRRCMPHKWRFRGCDFGVREAFIRARLEVAGSDWISYVQFRRLWSRPIKMFNRLRLLEVHPVQILFNRPCYGVPLSSMRSLQLVWISIDPCFSKAQESPLLVEGGRHERDEAAVSAGEAGRLHCANHLHPGKAASDPSGGPRHHSCGTKRPQAGALPTFFWNLTGATL
jgi:hypothetical protein